MKHNRTIFAPWTGEDRAHSRYVKDTAVDSDAFLESAHRNVICFKQDQILHPHQLKLPSISSSSSYHIVLPCYCVCVDFFNTQILLFRRLSPFAVDTASCLPLIADPCWKHVLKLAAVPCWQHVLKRKCTSRSQGSGHSDEIVFAFSLELVTPD